MALFKILRGNEEQLPITYTDGYAYFCTDTGSFFIDYYDGVDTKRKKISSEYAEKLRCVAQDGITVVELDSETIIQKIAESPNIVVGEAEEGSSKSIGALGAISNHSVALGYDTYAGSYSFKFDTNHTYTENDYTVATDGSITGKYYLTSVEGIQDKLNFVDADTTDDIEALEYSMQLTSNFDLNGKVIEVNIEENSITVDNYIIPNSSTQGSNIGSSSCIWFPFFPTIGTDVIGSTAFAKNWGNKAVQVCSSSEGYNNVSAGKYSHTEGRDNIAVYAAHAEGQGNKACGQRSHAEGHGNIAEAVNSHTEGLDTQAKGDNSHTEGSGTIAHRTAHNSHAEGQATETKGTASHAEGNRTVAEGFAAHAEGGYDDPNNPEITIAKGNCSHAEGKGTKSNGPASHSEGYGTTAGASYSHAEGWLTDTEGGAAAHAEGRETHANGWYSHTEGYKTIASGEGAHAEGYIYSETIDDITTTYETKASGVGSHAEGSGTKASATSSHAEGSKTTASGICSHTEGFGTTTTSTAAHSHAEGWNTISKGKAAHSEGRDTIAENDYSHAEGNNTKASGPAAHAEGKDTFVGGEASHVEGCNNQVSGVYCHAEGEGIKIMGNSKAMHVQGRYNEFYWDNTYAHVVGNGSAAEYDESGNITKAEKRSNAHTLKWTGDAWYAGSVSAGRNTTDSDGDLVLVTKGFLKSYVENAVKNYVDEVILGGEY